RHTVRVVLAEVLGLQHRVAALAVEGAGAAAAGPTLRSSTTSFFLVVSTTALGSTGLPTMAPTGSMSVYWPRKYKKSCLKPSYAAETGTYGSITTNLA